jgi:hypothetical protein
MNPTFNPTQRIFALNYLSNLCMGKKGTPQALQTWMHHTLEHAFADKEFISWMGEWKLMWGPVVVSAGGDVEKQVASNTMFVAYEPESATYVAAVAGTNPVSMFGWMVEDFTVQKTVPWIYEKPMPDTLVESEHQQAFGISDVRISEGTQIGLAILRKMQSNGKTIQEFFAAESQRQKFPQQLVVSGHSLGGALSATLALSLLNQHPFWDVQRLFTVSALPSAGATPGNNAFSEYYGRLLGTRTLRVWNVIDPVPHGWEPAMLEKVPFLYAPYLRGSVALGLISAYMVKRSLEGAARHNAGGMYTQLVPQTAPLPGQVSLQLITDAGEEAVPTVVHIILNALGGAFKDKFAAIMLRLHIAEAVQKLIFTAIKLLSETRWARNHARQFMDALLAQFAKITQLTKAQLEALQHLFADLLHELTVVFQFLVQLSYQHCAAYLQLMGIGAFETYFKALEDTYKKKSAPPEYEALLLKCAGMLLER